MFALPDLVELVEVGYWTDLLDWDGMDNSDDLFASLEHFLA